MIKKFWGLAAALVVAILLATLFASSTSAQTPPGVPKATATATAVPPKAPAAVPAPAKTGNAGLHATDVRLAPQQTATNPSGSDVAGALSAAALIGIIVAVVKMLLPGSLPSKITLLVVLGVSALVFGLELASSMVAGSPYALVGSFVSLVATAIGLREGVTAVLPQLSSQVTNTGAGFAAPPPPATP